MAAIIPIESYRLARTKQRELCDKLPEPMKEWFARNPVEYIEDPLGFAVNDYHYGPGCYRCTTETAHRIEAILGPHGYALFRAWAINQLGVSSGVVKDEPEIGKPV